MKIYFDDAGYAYLHAFDDEEVPEGYKQVRNEDIDVEHFLAHRKCYKWENGKIVYHPEMETSIEYETKRKEIREYRKYECFPVINRGELWYKQLNEDQLQELNAWYQEWLDATKTLTIPERPEWLKGM